MKINKIVIATAGILILNMSSAFSFFKPSLQTQLATCVKSVTLDALRSAEIKHTSTSDRTIAPELMSIIINKCEKEFVNLDKNQNMEVHIYGVFTSPILSAQRKFDIEVESQRLVDIEYLSPKEKLSHYLKEAKLIK